MDAFLQEQVEQLAKQIAGTATTQEELNEIFRGLMKSALQRMLDAEMEVHLGRTEASGQDEDSASSALVPTLADQQQPNAKDKSNRRNGHSKKTVQGELGKITLQTPRDRNGTFEPQLIPKHQRRVGSLDENILALYAKGMTTRDIQEILHKLYGVEVSHELIAEVTSSIQDEVHAFRTRPLDPVWPIVYLDGIVVHVRGNDARVHHHTVYVAIGVNLQGRKELLGLWLAKTEGAKYWLQVLTDLKNRGLKDIFVVCIDGLSGFAEAIRTAYPQTKVQLCVVHLVRAALRYVTDADSRKVAKDLKKIYMASTLAEAEKFLEEFAKEWDSKYPTISRSWTERWTDIITLFDFPWEIRKVIATTNVIESVNSVIRKRTRNRKIFPNEDSAFKHMYLAIREASKKWTMPILKWKEALNHFAILFEERMPK